MRARGTSGARPPGPADRDLWRRSQETEASRDEIERLLDLAGLADNRLDEDDAARVAALTAHDSDAAGDVAAALALADAAYPAADERVIARAAALVDETGSGARVIAFRAPRPAAKPWYGAATWSTLAAAIAFAGWLGFDLGSGLSNFPSPSRSPDDVSTSEFLDPAPLLLRDFTDSSQI